MGEVIACDLGSNTLRIVQLSCENGKRVKEFERIVRTAEGLYSNGYIGESAQKRILEALDEAGQVFDFKTLPVRCVTTEALRRASNATAVLQAIHAHTGLAFEIIDGTTEAALTLLGAQSALTRLDQKASSFWLMDLGGGSLELTCKAQDFTFSHSFPLGIVTLTEGDSGTLEASLEEIKHTTRSWPKASLLVATAGTPTTVSAFLHGMRYSEYAHEKITGTRLTCKDYEEALTRLLALEEKERERWVGVRRSDLIVTGINIITKLMQTLGFLEMIVVDDGLREGVAIALCERVHITR
ncbi:MAG: phosphatase [Campylobacterales bacterium]|nr:phosphatase [Campylobacterales bacterium]